VLNERFIIIGAGFVILQDFNQPSVLNLSLLSAGRQSALGTNESIARSS